MLKHYESWDKFAVTYGVKKTVIVNAITKTLKKIVDPLADELTIPIYKDEQIKKGIKFDEYPEVGLVVDVTFQNRTRPKMLYNEAKYYFSGKHCAYGYKTEVAHLPDGKAVLISDLYGGLFVTFLFSRTTLKFTKIFSPRNHLTRRLMITEN